MQKQQSCDLPSVICARSARNNVTASFHPARHLRACRGSRVGSLPNEPAKNVFQRGSRKLPNYSAPHHRFGFRLKTINQCRAMQSQPARAPVGLRIVRAAFPPD
jgi:hypothetical protein